MNLTESIRAVASYKKVKKEGLHVMHITRHVINMNNTLVPVASESDFEKLKRRINRILAYDVKKKRGCKFVRLQNPKTNAFRRVVYKLKK